MDIIKLVERILSQKGMVGIQPQPSFSFETNGDNPSKSSLENSLRNLEIALLFRDSENPAELIDAAVLKHMDPVGTLGLPLLNALGEAVDEARGFVLAEGESESRRLALSALADLGAAVDAFTARCNESDVAPSLSELSPFIKTCRRAISRMRWRDLSAPIHKVLDEVGSKRLSEIARSNQFARLRRVLSQVQERIRTAKVWPQKTSAEDSLAEMLSAIDEYDPTESTDVRFCAIVSYAVGGDGPIARDLYSHMNLAYANFVVSRAHSMGAELKVVGSTLVVTHNGREQKLDLNVPWATIVPPK